jgi:hypothetical protein
MVSDKARIAKLEKELELLRDQSKPKVSKGQVFAFLKTEKGAIVFIVSVFALASLIILVWPNSDSKPKQKGPVGHWENVCSSEVNPNWYEGASGLIGPEFYTRCDEIFIKN